MTRHSLGAECAVAQSRSSRGAGVVTPRPRPLAVPGARSARSVVLGGLAPGALTLLASLALIALLLSGEHAAESSPAHGQRLQSESLLSAPVALRRAVASTLARKESAYGIRSAGGALRAVSPAAQLRWCREVSAAA
jgi:hypothetical protein